MQNEMKPLDLAGMMRELSDPRFTAGMALLVGQLMVQLGVTEVRMSPDDYPLSNSDLVQFERDGDVLIARRLPRERPN